MHVLRFSFKSPDRKKRQMGAFEVARADGGNAYHKPTGKNARNRNNEISGNANRNCKDVSFLAWLWWEFSL